MFRNRLLWSAAALTGMVLLAGFSAVGAPRGDSWQRDFTQAAADAQQSGRLLLVHFHATWCLPCRQMERDVLHTNDVRDLLAKHFVAVMVDADKHPELQMQFNIQALPTDVILGTDGVVLMKSEGSRDKKTYVAQLIRALQQHSSEPKQEKPEPSKPEERIAEKTEPEGIPGENKLVVDKVPEVKKQPAPVKEKLLVGLDRYSPVSLAQNRQWRKGKSEYALVYQGVVYLLHDESEYREFQTDPAKFAPRLLGCDPVELFASDKAIPGSTQFGAYFDGDLFLFSSAANRDRFKQSPTTYSRTQHVLKIDDIDGPRWR